MENLRIVDRTIMPVDSIKGASGKFRAIVKCRAGFMTVVECMEKDVYSVFRAYKKGALKTIQFCSDEYDTWMTVAAMKGNKVVLADEELLSKITVGDINQTWYNTNLYSQDQYSAVGARTWADLAFVRKTTPAS